ncbi:prephenate dehydratase [Acidihalobacter prosperus]|uniref:prephenate dehydratase n=1 Tax=Acidihalobacter prosperus TaxID=160660 RepID=A0A1A6C8G3_9GAMM|nr:prephenate dehydratase [Acidihalobacter prosperus]
MRSGHAELAMLPVENSIAGRVADIHHLLPESSLRMQAEHFQPIRFHLMARPGVTLDDVREAHSHTMALGQCRIFLRRHDILAVTAVDTAGAAREVSESGRHDIAAIAPMMAAEVYGLNILAQNIEDHAHNTTRFVVMGKTLLHAERMSAEQDFVTAFLFRVRNTPAALYKAMGGFATNGVNMTKLESYMVDGSFTATQFYAEVDGHPDDRNVRLALEELDFFTSQLDIMGVYLAHPYRRSGRHDD